MSKTKKERDQETKNEHFSDLVNDKVPNTSLDSEYQMLFESIDIEKRGFISLNKLLKILDRMGIKPDDPRLQLSLPEEEKEPDEDATKIFPEDLIKIIQLSKGNLLKDTIRGNLVIPDFEKFCTELTDIFNKAKENRSGAVANYIPQLGRVNPEHFAVSVCTVDGQRFSLGDAKTKFCIQSISKPINYCLALEQNGEEYVHEHVGREPSGIGFNGLVLNSKGLPHNPMINAGAIMCCSMVQPEQEMADRFEYVLENWTRLSGGLKPNFNNSVYLSERTTADRNFALGYFMKENNAFPAQTNLIDTLEFYFQCCSIEVDAEAMAITAATLANAGTCPTTGEMVLKSDTVKNCLSLMSSCGMYDFSGEFAFTIGMPAKSGVGGGLMVVVPNLMGICIWSPRLDNIGNSVRGIDFCKRLVTQYNFHSFDSLTSSFSNKKDPRLRKNQTKINNIISLCWAASEGDLLEIQHLVAQGMNINEADYDGRTPLHLAASEGHYKAVEYLILHGANIMAVDRWGNTPLDDAYRCKHQSVIDLFEHHIKNN